MRIEAYLPIFKKLLILSTLSFLFLVSNITCFVVHAQNDNNALQIILYEDSSVSPVPKSDNIFFEGESYGVLIIQSKITESGETIPEIAYGVRITTPWGSYLTSETNPEIKITAPRFEEHREFVITASKSGFTDAEQLITVVKGTIHINLDKGTVEEGRSFHAYIQDHHNHAVDNCLVYIEIGNGQHGDSDFTNTEGIVSLSAPMITNDAETVSVIAYKDGYIGAAVELRVVPVVLIAADLISILPIVIAAVVVIIAMVIVRMKKTARFPQESKVRSHQKSEFVSRTTKRTTPDSQEPQLRHNDLSTKSDPRIEEIRIPVSNKRKETMYITSEKEHKQSSRENKKPEDKIYEGTDELRYTIDKITGKIDENQKDRWFEGTSDVQKKVDEAISKKYKKKNQK